MDAREEADACILADDAQGLLACIQEQGFALGTVMPQEELQQNVIIVICCVYCYESMCIAASYCVLL